MKISINYNRLRLAKNNHFRSRGSVLRYFNMTDRYMDRFYDSGLFEIRATWLLGYRSERS